MNSQDISINKGSSFVYSFTAKDNDDNVINLSAYSGRAMLRHKYSDNEPLISFATTITVPESGEITISLTSTETVLLPVDKAVYDVEIYGITGNDVIKLLNGYAEINPEATY